ncbi:MAG: SPASM domain-containing protein, partial [Nitrospirae bacterium]|nr:SPASM domain-containing protein [Nitrospirota bacterium]
KQYYKNKLIDVPFPPEVWIENTNCCNAKCIMCPRDKHTRPLGFMEFSLFERLIEEIARHKNEVQRVHLHNYGEPLLDKELPERIKLAKDLGIRHVYFVTNASLLVPDKSREIIEAGLDEFKISFYGTDKETYDNTMKGLNFDKTIQNVNDFLRIRKELGKSNPRVIIQYLPQTANKAKTDEFVSIFRPLIDKNIGDSLNIFSLHNFGDGRAYHKADKIVGICNYPWRTMVILHDGRVVICCLDFNGVQVVGDVNSNSIKEIWNGEQYRKARDNFQKLSYSDYPICMKCDRIR